MNILEYKFENLRNDPNWITPTKLVIKKFGSADRLARMLGISKKAIDQWPVTIPTTQQFKILQLARELKIRLTAQQLICGSKNDKE